MKWNWSDLKTIEKSSAHKSMSTKNHWWPHWSPLPMMITDDHSYNTTSSIQNHPIVQTVLINILMPEAFQWLQQKIFNDPSFFFFQCVVWPWSWFLCYLVNVVCIVLSICCAKVISIFPGVTILSVYSPVWTSAVISS